MSSPPRWSAAHRIPPRRQKVKLFPQPAPFALYRAKCTRKTALFRAILLVYLKLHSTVQIFLDSLHSTVLRWQRQQGTAPSDRHLENRIPARQEHGPGEARDDTQ